MLQTFGAQSQNAKKNRIEDSMTAAEYECTRKMKRDLTRTRACYVLQYFSQSKLCHVFAGTFIWHTVLCILTINSFNTTILETS